jgi:CIC family chloride channel protein
MLSACFAAMLIPTLLHNPPIYESLKARAVRKVSAAPELRGHG